jgi:glycosyltransferase involved in cell wall biosynthesis
MYQLNKYSIDEVQIMYIDNIFYHYLLDRVNYQKCIFRVMDEHPQFKGWNYNSKALAKRIAKKCDTLIYSAKGLLPYVKELKNTNSYFIPNGVDNSLFNKSNEMREIEHYLIRQVPKPIILYSGMIDTRIDFKLIRLAAKRDTSISYVFIGPVSGVARPKNLPNNVFFLGPVSHNVLPGIMKSASAGIIPFDIKNNMRRIRGIRPLKLFEYMAAGIPVITSRWPEIEALKSPAYIYDNVDEFCVYIDKVIRKKYDRASLKKFSEKYDWKKSFEGMIKKTGIEK